MNVQELNNRIGYSLSQRMRVTHLTLAITLGLILALLGVLTLAFSNQPGTKLHERSVTYIPALPPTSPPVPTPTTQRTPVASPSPTAPLPASLQQDIAFLQAQNLFFYHGNTSLPEVALTFDDGPTPYYTPQVLNILQEYGVKATFFCIGRQVANYPDLVRQEYAAGHIVGNHSWSHPNLTFFSPAVILSQLTLTSDAIQKATGGRPTFFRPPYGAFNRQVLTDAYHLGLTTVIWNADPRDWSRPGTDVIIARVLGQTGYGTIIVMHDGGGNRLQTIAALPTIITALRDHGIRFVTLQQLVDDIHTKAASSTPSPNSVVMKSPLLLKDWRRKKLMWYTASN
jgi:peptidoglycan/xylan/chitin deacetylase (PgdA/CDA1 family)